MKEMVKLSVLKKMLGFNCLTACKLSLILMVSSIQASCFNKNNQNGIQQENEMAEMTFMSDKDHEFGDIAEHDTIRYSFLFRNTSKVPLILDKVEPSCGCLKVIYPKYPVKPDAVDSICFFYDGEGFMPGRFIKSCRIFSNAKGERPITLIIRGYIE